MPWSGDTVALPQPLSGSRERNYDAASNECSVIMKCTTKNRTTDPNVQNWMISV